MGAYIYVDSIFQAKRFEGGAEQATLIINDFLRHGITATWSEAREEIEFEDGLVSPAAPERISFWKDEDRRVNYINVGDWLVSRHDGVSVMSSDRFYENFQPYASHNGDTIKKVYQAISKTVEDEKVVTGIINDLLDAGILFREAI